jgi:DNA-binding beta-propeller fold protein YncE
MYGGIVVKTWIVSTALLSLAVYLLLHTEPAATRVQSSALVIQEADGSYVNGSRANPSADTRLYWADAATGAIRRSAIDGSAMEIVADGVGIPYGMAFDQDTQALLWTDAAAETVQKLNVAGGQPDTLMTSFEEPYAIDISTGTEQAYYSATANIVYRNGYDAQTGGETSTAILTLPDTETIHGLALDTTNGILYIGDINGRMTRKLELAGQTAQSMPHTDTEVPPDAGAPGATPAI